MKKKKMKPLPLTETNMAGWKIPIFNMELHLQVRSIFQPAMSVHQRVPRFSFQGQQVIPPPESPHPSPSGPPAPTAVERLSGYLSPFRCVWLKARCYPWQKTIQDKQQIHGKRKHSEFLS